MADDPTPPLPITLAGHPDIRAVLADVLADEGYAVLSADDHAAALALAHRGPSRLVVLDVIGPDPEGEASCRAYREHGGTAPIVLVTDTDIDRAVVAGYGADAYIAKPFDLDDLLAIVRRLAGPG